jgi:protein-tyrosine kinase
MNNLIISNFPTLNYAADEAFNTLCTNITFSGENIRKIMLTSTYKSEGKSFVAMNIMRTLAKFGKNTILVDADLRRSVIDSNYGIQLGGDYKFGLVHMLAGMASARDVIYKTDIPHAWMVPVGRDISNPLPLLNSPKFGLFLDELAKTVDYVIVDTPPIGTVIDAAQIAKSCDGVLLVVGYNAVRRQELVNVKTQIEQTGCPILGTVLNQVELDSYVNRKYYNKSYYYNDKASQSGDHSGHSKRSGRRSKR